MSVLITLLFGVAALFSAAFGFMELRLIGRFLKHREAIRSSPEWHGNGTGPGHEAPAPTVTIQIPLYNERTSAAQIVRAAASQEYPRDRFDIQVLDDSTDETSTIVAQVAEEVRRGGVAIQHLRREDRRGYKAGAMAEGLRHSDSDFVAVFDADFLPEPGFLRSLLRERTPFEDPRVAFVQARWAWGDHQSGSWFARVLALLLDRHFHIQKPTRAQMGNVTTFNGSGGIWRRAAIDDAGGWTSDTLTEDLDLSYRCALAGWRGHYLRDVKVVNELPGHMRAFKLQQRRWAKGTAQVFRKIVGRLLGRGSAVDDKLEEITLLAGYAIHPLLFGCLLLWPWAVLYMDRGLFWVAQGFMAVGVVATVVSLLVTIHERDRGLRPRAIRDVVASICVGIGLMVNNTIAQIQGIFASGGEFVRTPKGVPGAGAPAGNGVPSPRGYGSPLHWSFYVEVLVMAYCGVGAYVLVQAGEPLWAIAMFMWALCLGVVVQQQLRGQRV